MLTFICEILQGKLCSCEALLIDVYLRFVEMHPYLPVFIEGNNFKRLVCVMLKVKIFYYSFGEFYYVLFASLQVMNG